MMASNYIEPQDSERYEGWEFSVNTYYTSVEQYFRKSLFAKPEPGVKYRMFYNKAFNADNEHMPGLNAICKKPI